MKYILKVTVPLSLCDWWSRGQIINHLPPYLLSTLAIHCLLQSVDLTEKSKDPGSKEQYCKNTNNMVGSDLSDRGQATPALHGFMTWFEQIICKELLNLHIAFMDKSAKAPSCFKVDTINTPLTAWLKANDTFHLKLSPCVHYPAWRRNNQPGAS